MQNTQTKTYTPTEAVLDNIQRAIALKAKYNRTSIASARTQVAINKSNTAVEQGFTLEQVKQMYNTLSKLEGVDLRKRLHDSGPSEEAINWYAAGGSAGLAWSRLILKQEQILKTYSKEILKQETEQTDDSTEGKIPVVKSVDKLLKQVTYVAMKPGVDLHGDLVDLDDIRIAKESFNKSAQRANLFHMLMTDSFEVAESYLAPCDMVLNGNFVQKGEWLMTLQILDDGLWEMIQKDEIVGISIGAMAKVEKLEE